MLNQTPETRKINTAEVILANDKEQMSNAILPSVMPKSPLDWSVEMFTQALDRREINRKALLKWIESNLQHGVDYGQIHVVGKSDYVFLNYYCRPLLPNSVNFHIWKPALKKAGLKPRSLYQTRHTFATLMIDAGELPGWVQKMMGHESLKMILERYYSYIKNYQRDDGSAFMDNVYNPSVKQDDETPDEGKKSENLHQIYTKTKKGN